MEENRPSPEAPDKLNAVVLLRARFKSFHRHVEPAIAAKHLGGDGAPVQNFPAFKTTLFP